LLAAGPASGYATVAGIAIGLALTLVHIIGIPLTGTSVNPARSIGPALFAGGDALTQLWVFIIAPLLGGVLSALAYLLLYSEGEGEAEADVEPAQELQP
jgi:aquaporin Z